VRRLGKVRLACDAGEGVGRSQSVIVVRDDLGVLEIFANKFESKAGTAHEICGLVSRARERWLATNATRPGKGARCMIRCALTLPSIACNLSLP